MMPIMRYPDGHKAHTRQRIIEATSQALRRHGLKGVSIPATMKRAGLTHGGFYSHFKNRDELAAEAVLSAAEGSAQTLFANSESLAALQSGYLSTEHLQHPELGCVLAALGTSGPRQAKPIRAAFAKAARGFIGLIDAKIRRNPSAPVPSDAALRHASTMLGAIVLGRLVEDPALAARILRAARASD
jgi:TetR/AcrR family transcriptional regulator, transcriptional repressor for nem operon